MNNVLLRCEKLSKSYHDGTTSIAILKEIDFAVKEGERIAIIGPSGSGKSTLLHLLGGLDKPTEGGVFLNGQNWLSLSEKRRCQLRNQHLGFVYQFHHLLPEFTAMENVAIPLILGSQTVPEAQAAALSMLDKVGLSARATHKPSELSGGERQRVAIARALVRAPSLLLADEPTGNLDQTTAARVFDLMLELNIAQKTALLIVTHDINLASKMDKILTIKDGILTES